MTMSVLCGINYTIDKHTFKLLKYNDEMIRFLVLFRIFLDRNQLNVIFIFSSIKKYF